jgi:cell division protein FtsZ
MTINLSIPQEISDLKPRITVVGVGGAGGNAVNNMVRSNLVGCEFIACNTDAQALHLSAADRKIQLGQSTTRGLGAGSRPDVGRQAAEEAMDEIMEHLRGSNMVFITAGMGGGTGTGAAPVIARAARESGILTVGVITKPFHFEGTHRMRLAESGIEELQKFVDTLLIIPNQNLFRVANERTTFAEAFKMADDVLHAGVRGVTDLMVMPGLINLDFADIRAVMMEMGKAMMGTGEATGDKRAIDAAEAAISNPLLDDVSMLINITGGLDMTLFEVDEAANRIREEVDPEANIIFGSTFDEKLEGKMRISVVATGIDAEISRMANEAVNAVQPAEPRRTGPVLAFPTAAATAPVATAPVPTIAPQPVAEPAAISNFTRVASGSASQPAEPVIGDAPFIAPRPMTPASRSQGNLAESEPMSDARAKKQQEPARPQPAAPSLFRRMIGLQAAAPTPKAKTKATLDAMRTAQSAPPRATGTTQADRPQHGVTEEDYLDIPAFLRRQAN